MTNTNLSDKDLLEALDRELNFYRNKLHWLFTYCFAAQLLIITGQRTIPIGEPLVGKVAYTCFFLGIAFFALLLRGAYVNITYHLRGKRIELIEKTGYKNIYPQPGGVTVDGKRPMTSSRIYILAVWALSIIGILITWLGR